MRRHDDQSRYPYPDPLLTPHADIDRLADLRDAEALFFDHADEPTTDRTSPLQTPADSNSIAQIDRFVSQSYVSSEVALVYEPSKQPG